MDAPHVDINQPPGHRPESLRTLVIHLRALGSYFRLTNHPLTEANRSELPSRDFINETSVGHEFLLRCAALLLTLKEEAVNQASGEYALSFSGGVRSPYPILAPTSIYASLESLTERVNDLFLLGGALVESRRVGFDAWCAYGKLVSREVELYRPEELFDEGGPGLYAVPLPAELAALMAHITPDSLAADVGSIFSRLFELLELLGFVGKSMAADAPLKQTLPFFTLLREKCNRLTDLICERALRVEGLDESVHEQLDATAYALRMELKKAFEHELVGLAVSSHAPHVYAKVENAHGLLRDCFQQSIISIARTFDSDFDGARLFNTFRTKLDESLLLRDDLWQVLAAVRRAEGEREQRACQALLSILSAFRETSLRYLMYKDWESFERFVDEVNAAKEASELQPALHRFHAFLETLFSQVNMRAVLMDYPFTPPQDAE